MISISALELVYNRLKLGFVNMLPVIFVCISTSVLFTSILGNIFAIQSDPWYKPRNYIPILGMLLGNAMSSVTLGLNSILKQLQEGKEVIELYLAFGGSRWEVGKPIIKDAIRTAMLPGIINMSVIGLISIPGMMSGQILGGSSIKDAVHYQQIIMFMITSVSLFASSASVIACLFICIDADAYLRLDKITIKKDGFKWKDFVALVKRVFNRRQNSEIESGPLLSDS